MGLWTDIFGGEFIPCPAKKGKSLGLRLQWAVCAGSLAWLLHGSDSRCHASSPEALKEFTGRPGLWNGILAQYDSWARTMSGWFLETWVRVTVEQSVSLALSLGFLAASFPSGLNIFFSWWNLNSVFYHYALEKWGRNEEAFSLPHIFLYSHLSILIYWW